MTFYMSWSGRYRCYHVFSRAMNSCRTGEWLLRQSIPQYVYLSDISPKSTHRQVSDMGRNVTDLDIRGAGTRRSESNMILGKYCYRRSFPLDCEAHTVESLRPITPPIPPFITTPNSTSSRINSSIPPCLILPKEPISLISINPPLRTFKHHPSWTSPIYAITYPKAG
jgi:hypothetical protein